MQVWRKNSWCLGILILILIPSVSSLEISEIMYDLEGGDEGYEWIEIYNDGDEINFCEYKFYEAETHHKLDSSSCTLAAGEYVIIADVTENLDFSCNLFDSSWQTLSNTGEELCIRDSEKNDVVCVTYSSDWGAAGDGDSLQFVDGEWIAAEPTPGEQNQEPVAEPQEEVMEEQEPDDEEQEPDDEEQEPEIEEAEIIVPAEEETMIKEPAVEETAAEEAEEVEQEPKIVYLAKTETSLKTAYFLLLFISLALNALFIVYTLKRKS